MNQEDIIAANSIANIIANIIAANIPYRETPEWKEAKREADIQNAIQSAASKTTLFNYYPIIPLDEYS